MSVDAVEEQMPLLAQLQARVQMSMSLSNELVPPHLQALGDEFVRALGTARREKSRADFFVFSPVQTASRENWLSRSLALRSQVQCPLAVASRLNGTIRRASHQSPGNVFAM
jgi:hypothetical protein